MLDDLKHITDTAIETVQSYASLLSKKIQMQARHLLKSRGVQKEAERLFPGDFNKNKRQNFVYLQSATGYDIQSLSQLEIPDIPLKQFAVFFDRFENKDFDHLKQFLEDISMYSGGNFLLGDLIDELEECSFLRISNFKELIEFITSCGNIDDTLQFLSLFSKLLNTTHTNQIIQLKGEEIKVSLRDKSTLYGEHYISGINDIQNFAEFSKYFCTSLKEYEKWRKTEKSDALIDFFGNSNTHNFRYYISQFNTLDDFLEHSKTTNFHLLSNAAGGEWLPHDDDLIRFRQVYQKIQKRDFDTSLSVKDELYFDNDACKPYAACPVADTSNHEILSGELKYIYKKYYLHGQLIGYTKNNGTEHSFLALRDVVNADQDIILLKGCIYSIEWKAGDENKKRIDVAKDSRALSFLRSLQYINKIGKRTKAHSSLELVRKDIDTFMKKYKRNYKIF